MASSKFVYNSSASLESSLRPQQNTKFVLSWCSVMSAGADPGGGGGGGGGGVATPLKHSATNAESAAHAQALGAHAPYAQLRKICVVHISTRTHTSLASHT